MCACYLPVWEHAETREGEPARLGWQHSALRPEQLLIRLPFNSARELKALCAEIEDRGVLSKGSDRTALQHRKIFCKYSVKCCPGTV